jgi:hypothetical protein
VKTPRVILGAVLAIAALAGHAQSRPWHGQGGGGGHAWGGRAWGGGQRFAPQGGGRRYAPPAAYPGRGFGGYAPSPGYAPQAQPAYAPGGFPPPERGAWRAPEAWRGQEEFLRQGVRQGQLAPLGSVIQNIRRITPGRQLDSGLEYMGPRPVYRVRWMTANGRRVDYFVDAATGAILSGR